MCAWVRIDSQASAGAAADSQASTDADPSGTDATAHTEPVRLQRTVSTRRVTAARVSVRRRLPRGSSSRLHSVRGARRVSHTALAKDRLVARPYRNLGRPDRVHGLDLSSHDDGEGAPRGRGGLRLQRRLHH